MFGHIDQAIDRHWVTAATVEVAEQMAIGMGARERVEIGLGEDAFALRNQSLGHVGHGCSLLQVLGINVPTAVSGQLVTDAADNGVLQPKTQDAANLVQVGVVFHRGDEGAAEAVFFELIEGLKLNLREGFATQALIGAILKPIELEIDFQTVAHGGQLGDQGGVARQADAVGVDHHGLDRLFVGITDHAHQIGMEGRLAAGELQHVGNLFEVDIAIDHALIGGKVDVFPARSRFGETHGAFEITTGGNLDQSDAGVCCSCSGQRPQSKGQPLSEATPYDWGRRAGWLSSWRS